MIPPSADTARTTRTRGRASHTTPALVVPFICLLLAISPSHPRSLADATLPPGSESKNTKQPPPAANDALSITATRRRLAESRLRILIPAYFYPGGKSLEDWERMIAASSRVPLIAVINVNSGPGLARNPEYAAMLDRAIDRGVTLIGYIYTNYGKRPAAEVEAEIDHWLDYYPRIQGIFFDAQPGPAGFESYYESLSTYARRKIRDPLVIANPGTSCAPSYLDPKIANVTCVVESANSLANYHLPLTAGRFTSSRFAALCFGVDKVEVMRSYVEKLPELRLGYVFITDQQLPNPWLGLPQYWDAEVDAVRRVNLRQSVFP